MPGLIMELSDDPCKLCGCTPSLILAEEEFGSHVPDERIQYWLSIDGLCKLCVIATGRGKVGDNAGWRRVWVNYILNPRSGHFSVAR